MARHIEVTVMGAKALYDLICKCKTFSELLLMLLKVRFKDNIDLMADRLGVPKSELRHYMAYPGSLPTPMHAERIRLRLFRKDVLGESLFPLVCKRYKKLVEPHKEGQTLTPAETKNDANLPNLKRMKEYPEVTKALEAEQTVKGSKLGWRAIVGTCVDIRFSGSFNAFGVAMQGQLHAVTGGFAKECIFDTDKFSLRRDELFTMCHSLGMTHIWIREALLDYERELNGKFLDNSFSLRVWQRTRNRSNCWNTRKRKGESKAKSKVRSKKSIAKSKVQQELPLTVQAQEKAIKPSNGVVTHEDQLHIQMDASLGRMVKRAAKLGLSEQQLGLVVGTCVEVADELISNVK